MPNVENPKLEDVDGINRILKGKKTKYQTVVVFFKKGTKAKMWERKKGTYSEPKMEFLVRERERLLSEFSANPTVRILRSKKESCSTRRGQRVDSGFKEFRKTL